MGVLGSLIGFRLRMAQLAVYEDFLSDSPAGLTPGHAAIVILVAANPEMTQQELCEAVRVDKSTFAITLNRLEKRGLLRRVRSRMDRRQNMLRLTKKGASTLRAIRAVLGTWIRWVRGAVARVSERVDLALRTATRPVSHVGGLLRDIVRTRRNSSPKTRLSAIS